MSFLIQQNSLKARTVSFSLTIFSTVRTLSSSLLIKAFTELVLLEWIENECQKWNRTNRWREVIANIILTVLFAVNYLCFSSISGLQSTSTVQRISHKKSILIPDIIKMYNQGMCGVDLVDQRTAAYHLDRKSWIRFYLCIFFDLWM